MHCLIVDGNSIVNRAFYGISILKTAEGVITNAVSGFLSILLKELEVAEYDGVAVCFDVHAPTFRHEMYTEYKAQRKPSPPELHPQFALVKNCLDLMGIARIEKPGYEADDLIGTLCRRLSSEGHQATVLTGDRDDYQLIDENTFLRLVITRMGKTDTHCYDRETFVSEFGYEPLRVIDLKALMGDTSDNIPGVKGIGEKGATELVRSYGTIENIYENVESLDIKDSLRKKLKDGKESAVLSYTLAKIDCDVPLDADFSLDSLKRGQPQDGLFAYLTKLELNRILARLKLSPKDADVTAPVLEEMVLQGADSGFFSRAETEESVYTREGDGGIVLFSDSAFRLTADELPVYFAAGGKKIAFDAKEELLLFDVRNLYFDCRIAAWLLNIVDSGFTLSQICKKVLGLSPEDAAAPLKKDEQLSFDSLEEPDDAGAVRRAQCILLLYQEFLPRLEKMGLSSLFFDVEMPLIPVLACMQKDGFLVDGAGLRAFSAELLQKTEEEKAQVFSLAGEEFNLNSTKQLGAILFEKLGLKSGKKTKSGYSTDAEVLSKLSEEHEIVRHILAYRTVSKLRSTYTEGLLQVMEKDGRIHSSLNQTGTVTGRLSSSEPNVQNIPIRQAYGSQIRAYFIARPGCVLIDGDYSQIELRILAHLSEDETMRAAFIEGEDIHTRTAGEIFGVSKDAVTKEMRTYAKAINFGMVYGISEFSLAADIGSTRAEAKAYMEEYFARFKQVKLYMDTLRAQVKEQGFVDTILKRRRVLPDVASPHFSIRAAAERMALNAPMQGSAADIIKIAMVRIWARLQREGLQTKLIMQVHDELILEAPEDEKDIAAALLKEEMEAAYSLTVPLVADVSVGKSWLAAK